jgi:arginase family enzyme
MQIIKVPGLNSLEENKGVRDSGNLVIGEIKKIKDISYLDLEEIHVNNFDLIGQEKLIYENSKEVFEIKDKIIFLGGDHSITYPIGKAFLENFGEKNSFLIIFDAHVDILNLGKKDNLSWLSSLINLGWRTENIFLIGLRNLSLVERSFLIKNRLNYFEIDKIEDFEIFCDGIMEKVNQVNSKIYVSFDIGVVDPAFAPSTKNLESGGITGREILYFARRFSKLKGLKAIDLVEIDNEKDGKKGKITLNLGARIVSEFIN